MPYYYSPLRKDYEPDALSNTDDTCPFCTEQVILQQTFVDSNGAYIENEHYRWIVNWYPRAEAHTMLVPKRHITNLTDETDAEVLARHALLTRCVSILHTVFPDSGMEIFLQNGNGTASSVPHLHWHVVPAIPQHSLTGFEKLGYFFTTEPAEKKVVITPIEITIARDKLLTLIARTEPHSYTKE